MSAAPGSEEPGFKPDSAKSGSLSNTIKSASNMTSNTNSTTSSNSTSTAVGEQQRRRSSVDKYSEIRKMSASGAYTHEHADLKNNKPGVLGSLFSSYIKGGN